MTEYTIVSQPFQSKWRISTELFEQLSVRAQNAIANCRCLTDVDVVKKFKTNPHVPNCGKKTLKEIRDVFGIEEICPHCGNPLKGTETRK